MKFFKFVKQNLQLNLICLRLIIKSGITKN